MLEPYPQAKPLVSPKLKNERQKISLLIPSNPFHGFTNGLTCYMSVNSIYGDRVVNSFVGSQTNIIKARSTKQEIRLPNKPDMGGGESQPP